MAWWLPTKQSLKGGQTQKAEDEEDDDDDEEEKQARKEREKKQATFVVQSIFCVTATKRLFPFGDSSKNLK